MTNSLADFVEGVFIEVLWDVERTNDDGRRKGEKTVESIWWKGEVLDVRQDGGKTMAKLRYEAMAGFNSQIGEVRVFPAHILLIHEADTTQLRWRYYESSGDIPYESGTTSHEREQDSFGNLCCSQHHIGSLQSQVEEVIGRIEHVERFIVTQGEISRVTTSATNPEICSQRLFALLRQKLATVVQKPLLPYKHRNESNGTADTLFDFSCAGSMRVQVDCTLAEFEVVCRAVKSLSATAYFRVDGSRFFPLSDSFPASLSAADIQFVSLSQLCGAIGITHQRDIMSIARRERKQAKMGSAEDAAIRVAGTFLADVDVEGTPSVILLCTGLHDAISLHKEVDVLTRDNRELDPRTLWYRSPLRIEKMKVSSLLHHVYPALFQSSNDTGCAEAHIQDITKYSSFALRWKPLSNPNPKTWTREMVMPPYFAGALEVEIPYILIRGSHGVNEFNGLVTMELMKKQLSDEARKTSSV